MKPRNHRREFARKEYRNRLAATSVILHGSDVKGSRLGEYCRVKPYCEVRGSTLGDYSVLSSHSIINASDVGKFNSIGAGVFIGLWEHNLWVSTHSFYLTEVCGGFVEGFRDFERDHVRTTVGHDVWVGANVCVLKGVTVGSGAILGAGSVVTKDVPPYAIAVGNPARVLRYRFEPRDIEYLLELRWWDFERAVLQEMVDRRVWDSLDKVRAFCAGRTTSKAAR